MSADAVSMPDAMVHPLAQALAGWDESWDGCAGLTTFRHPSGAWFRVTDAAICDMTREQAVAVGRAVAVAVVEGADDELRLVADRDTVMSTMSVRAERVR